MTRNEQVSRNSDGELGLLITKPRRYNAFNDIFFAGKVNALITTIANLSDAASGDRILDIASGPGKLARVLADRVAPAGEVIGVDAAREMVDYATAQSRAFPNCRFEFGVAQSLTFPDASFDVVTSTFSMHHIPADQRDTALAGMYRVLRPGGRLLLADMNPRYGVRGVLIRTMARVSAHHTGDDHAHGDVNAALDIRRYQNTLRDLGFEDFRYTDARHNIGILTARRPA